MSLSDARDARECRVLARKDVDPALEKQRAKAEAMAARAFAEVADD